MVFSSVSAIITIFIIIAVGYIITRAKWYSESAQTFISKFVFNVALPVTIVCAFLKNFSVDMVSAYAPAFIAAACGTVATYLLGKLFARILKLKRNRIGIFTMLVAVSNCGFIGFPLSQIMFGDEGAVATALFFLVQNLLINAVGLLEISADGDQGSKPEKKEILKRVFNPLMITTVGSLVVAICGLSFDMLPEFVSKTLSLIDGITAPLSLIFIGMVLGSIGLKNLAPRKGMPTLFILRFIACPLMMALFCRLFNVDNLTTTIFIVISALPSMVQISIMAKTVGANVKYAVACIFYTTVLAFGSVPIWSVITSMWFG